MTTIAARTFASKFLREWNILRPFQAYTPRCAASTNTAEEENIPDDIGDNLLNPLNHPDFFQVHNLFTVKNLFDARVHYGHKEGTLHDQMKPFLFGSRLGHLIIDLDQTAELMRDALNFIAHIAFKDGIILFISRNPQITQMVDKTAKECEEFSHTRHWRDGVFTNSTFQFGTTTRLPDLCIFLSTLDNVLQPHRAVRHAAKLCIPSVGIVDTNCNPNIVTYPIPGNDDSPCAIKLYLDLFKEAIMRGKSARKMLENPAKL